MPWSSPAHLTFPVDLQELKTSCRLNRRRLSYWRPHWRWRLLYVELLPDPSAARSGFSTPPICRPAPPELMTTSDGAHQQRQPGCLCPVCVSPYCPPPKRAISRMDWHYYFATSMEVKLCHTRVRITGCDVDCIFFVLSLRWIEGTAFLGWETVAGFCSPSLEPFYRVNIDNLLLLGRGFQVSIIVTLYSAPFRFLFLFFPLISYRGFGYGLWICAGAYKLPPSLIARLWNCSHWFGWIGLIVI